MARSDSPQEPGGRLVAVQQGPAPSSPFNPDHISNARTNPLLPDAAGPLLEIRGPRVSSVIVHRVPLDCADRFLEWQRGVTQAAEACPGYQATDLYPPAGPKQPEWVVVIHFDNSAALQSWLDSPGRAEWTAKLPAEIATFRLKTLSAGFGPWFAGLVDSGSLPHWKMALAVLLGLYPTVMLLNVFVLPHHDRFGMALTILMGNILGCCLLEWAVMPALNILLGSWLRANGPAGKTTSAIGLVLIVAVLGGMALLFRQMTG
jgi:antibiotic biosynthesis monooxygenase (ABM) superfamily enzyme